MNLRVEVINTGTELLLGAVINTHLSFFAEAIFPLGLRIQRQVTVPDGEVIGEALKEAFTRADIVLVTGGLGPTTDDITREAVADLLAVKLVHDESVMTSIKERFARRGFVINERVGRQAQRPSQATVLVNHHGTAPGLYLPPLAFQDSTSPHLFLLPGPPRELKPMFTESVVPLLKALLPAGATTVKRTYRVTGLGESFVEQAVGEELLGLGIELGYCARPGEVDIRVIGSSDLLARADSIIRKKLGAAIVSSDERSLQKVVIDALILRGETLTTAESCTGGHLADTLTNVPGASAVFPGGFVTYSNPAKIRDLGVKAASIDQYGAASAIVASEMAVGALRIAGTDFALATTGIAGPEDSRETSAGTVYIALATKNGTCEVVERKFPTDRETFKSLTTQTALDLLRRNQVERP